jgi:hypothetical protein
VAEPVKEACLCGAVQFEVTLPHLGMLWSLHTTLVYLRHIAPAEAVAEATV